MLSLKVIIEQLRSGDIKNIHYFIHIYPAIVGKDIYQNLLAELKKSVETNQPQSVNDSWLLATMFQYGLGCEKSHEEAWTYYEKVSTSVNSIAKSMGYYGMGLIQLNAKAESDKAKNNFDLAISSYQQNHLAHYALGVYFENVNNKKNAEKSFEAAKKLGNAEAPVKLVNYLNVLTKFTGTRPLYVEAAQCGNITAASELANYEHQSNKDNERSKILGTVSYEKLKDVISTDHLFRAVQLGDSKYVKNLYCSFICEYENRMNQIYDLLIADSDKFDNWIKQQIESLPEMKKYFISVSKEYYINLLDHCALIKIQYYYSKKPPIKIFLDKILQIELDDEVLKKFSDYINVWEFAIKGSQYAREQVIKKMDDLSIIQLESLDVNSFNQSWQDVDKTDLAELASQLLGSHSRFKYILNFLSREQDKIRMDREKYVKLSLIIYKFTEIETNIKKAMEHYPNEFITFLAGKQINFEESEKLKIYEIATAMKIDSSIPQGIVSSLGIQLNPVAFNPDYEDIVNIVPTAPIIEANSKNISTDNNVIISTEPQKPVLEADRSANDSKIENIYTYISSHLTKSDNVNNLNEGDSNKVINSASYIFKLYQDKQFDTLAHVALRQCDLIHQLKMENLTLKNQMLLNQKEQFTIQVQAKKIENRLEQLEPDSEANVTTSCNI